MQDPERFVMPFGVLNTTMVINTCLCLTIGFFGYLRFGDAILGSITYNIPNSPPIYAAVKPLFICAIFLSYILQFYVPATIFGRLLLKFRGHRETSPHRQSVCRKMMRMFLILCTSGVFSAVCGTVATVVEIVNTF
ncbi:unnamed protein product [Hydatigera taeniaeformis]|uniref:Aa_trans domain-containing protein n=1 Tax=Hydatigena taeniaeformis TaxID=6205 RepID=A0A0R3XBT0_HYDTA|nr:unnamed protein product [Hydatigera taeniaeformis]